jgi:hypothetical protein
VTPSIDPALHARLPNHWRENEPTSSQDRNPDERDLTDGLAVALRCATSRKRSGCPDAYAIYIDFLYGFLEFGVGQKHRRSRSDVQL